MTDVETSSSADECVTCVCLFLVLDLFSWKTPQCWFFIRSSFASTRPNNRSVTARREKSHETVNNRPDGVSFLRNAQLSPSEQIHFRVKEFRDEMKSGAERMKVELCKDFSGKVLFFSAVWLVLVLIRMKMDSCVL